MGPPPTMADPGTAAPEVGYAVGHWEAEAAACAADPAYFVDTYGVIDKPKRPSSAGEDFIDEVSTAVDTDAGTVPFRLWPAQVPVLGTLATSRLILILKARQLGISWLVCGYVLWLCLFYSGQVVFLFSRRQKDANELIRRIKALYNRLPVPLKLRVAHVAGKDNVREIAWSNGSRIESMPATKDSGVGNTASCVVLDEWAKMPWGGELFESVKPVMEAGGQLIILSTADGLNWFFALWDRAVKGLNSFRTIFLPWWARPGRDKPWYAQVLRDSHDPERVKQEYPSSPTEAFRSSGHIRFASDWIDAQAPHVKESLPTSEWPEAMREVPRLRVYQRPLVGHTYVVAADVAEGLETSNYDAAVVLCAETLEEVACLHGQWEPDVYAGFLILLSQAYNNALVIPERNNHGHAVLATFKLKGFSRIGLGHDGARGWHTGGSTKDLTIDFLAECLRTGRVKVRSAAALSEFRTYKRLKNGTTGAEKPFYDDLVMAWAIGLYYLRQGFHRRDSGAPKVGGPSTRGRGFLTGTPGPLKRHHGLGFPGTRRS